MSTSVESKKGLDSQALPLREYIESIGHTQDEYVIQKVSEVCQPIIEEIIRNHLKALKTYTGIFDFEVQAATNANRAVEKFVEEKGETLEGFWKTHEPDFKQHGFSEEIFWTCVEWVPTRQITVLLRRHEI